MLRDVVAGIQESLKQEQAPTNNLMTMEKPFDNVKNAMHSTQKQLAT